METQFNRRDFIKRGLAGSAAAAAMAAAPGLSLAMSGKPPLSRNNKRPNIILIMVDDMGFSDIAATAGKLKHRTWTNWHKTD